MKRIFLSALIGVGMVALIFPLFSGSEAAPTQQSYPLVCRGSANLAIGTAPGEGNIGFVFTRGTKPAGEGLAPGECSWVDRGMYADEPDRLSQHVANGSESLKAGPNLPNEKVRLPSIHTNRWYEDLDSPDKYWTFQVSNNGRGQLIATSARPNPGMEVSPTARVPSAIGQIIRPDLPRARTLGDETPGMIVLNGPAETSSRAERLEGLSVERDMNIPPATRSLSTEEKTALLKSAGLETYSEPPTPYVTLTPQQPYVAGRGSLDFRHPIWVSSDENLANMEEVPGRTFRDNYLIVRLNFETKGTYLMTFTVTSRYVPLGAGSEFVISVNGTRKTFLVKKTAEWQHLNMIVEVAKPGEYSSFLYLQADPKETILWWFRSCDVTIWKK